MSLVPLTAIHYKDPNIERNVKFQHIIIFIIAGSLLILCTLFNYLSLFITRFKIRQKELALRVVFGASNRSLFALLSVEFLISLFAALLLGVFFMEIGGSAFRETSGIKMDMISICLESAIYIAGIILISLLAFITMLAIFRRRTLNASIHQRNRKLFRKASIVVQLVISIGFTFCTTIILKQMYHVHNIDLGMTFDNRGSVYTWFNSSNDDSDYALFVDKMRQIPEITDAFRDFAFMSDYFNYYGLDSHIAEWDEKSGNANPVQALQIPVSERLFTYHEVQLIEGEMMSDSDDENTVMINESTAQALGWYKSAGKSFTVDSKRYRVKGVIRNIRNVSPASRVGAYIYTKRPTSEIFRTNAIVFKCHEGTWKTCREKIAEIAKTDFPSASIAIYNSQEEYNKFMKSENTLLWILSLISTVCVIVCVFGFVSMVTLTCEERRKEIAIRKINGATIKDILDIFFKEYLTLLIIGALIAFPAGYVIMKDWLAGYVIQTEINVYVYVAILLALIMTIILCVGGKVYKTSRENPVNAINR
jgi:predicted lysophospholipase L1 biosynthesis ABC-type transport system permease subunit